MNPKSITRIVLLAVIALAIGGWAIKEFSTTTATEKAAGESGGAADFTRPDGVTVINFHGDTRCRTCVSIGNLASKTVDEHLTEARQSGELHWEIINYDAPENTHFVTDYELVSPTVVATLWRDGKEVKWERLDGVWEHLNDETTFQTYVAHGVRELMNLP